MTPRTILAALCSVLLSLASPAHAQDQSPNSILEASATAIGELKGFSAQFKMKGEGGSMLANTMPEMSGQLFFGHHDTYGPVLHCIGELRETKTTPSKPMEILLARDRYLWTDHSSKTINEYPSSGNTRGLPSAFNLVLIKSITQDDPYYNDVNNAQSIELLAQESIGGVLCDVIEIKRAKPARGARQSSSNSYTDARWYIGTKDKLPRRVDQITDAGLIKITLSFELSNLKAAKVGMDKLEIPRPEGYTFNSRIPKPRVIIDERTQIPPPTPDASPAAETSTRTQPTPKLRRAPAYAFTPVGGSPITNATQDGRITVLYFWGSWCVPCKAASALVSELAQSMSDQADALPVDVFGLAIREADPEKTRSGFAAQGYHHQLVLGSDDLVSKFRVRVFPTIVVIDQLGEIVFQQSITKETSVEALVDGAKSAIEALKSAG